MTAFCGVNKLKQSQWISEAGLDDFREKVIEASKQQPIVVDFWADWCSPCHAIAPHISRAIDELEGRVLLVKVEVDEGENMKLAGRYKVRGFPTVILIIDGEEVNRFSGAKPLSYLRNFVDDNVNIKIKDK